MLKKYSRAVLFCPLATTGGPEAIHQLNQLLNEIGIDSSIAYYGQGARIARNGASLICTAPEANVCLRAYAKYNPTVCTKVELTDTTLVMLPEVLANDIDKFRPAQVGVWWLSVDNGFLSANGLSTETAKKNFFENRQVLQFCQTFYSRDILHKNGVGHVYDLVDYTDDLFTSRPPKKANLGTAIAYNPKKGSELSEQFFGLHPKFQPRPIRGMNKQQIYECFRETQVYIEFGHNPGKDRMPREAACTGCIVLARRLGGTAYFDDVPLEDEFKFEEKDVTSGRLADLVSQIQSNPEPFWQRQSYYRNYLYTERDLMRFQVRRLFALSDYR